MNSITYMKVCFAFLVFLFLYYIKDDRPCLSTSPNIEKTVENTTRSGVFLSLEVCSNKYLLNRNWNQGENEENGKNIWWLRSDIQTHDLLCFKNLMNNESFEMFWSMTFQRGLISFCRKLLSGTKSLVASCTEQHNIYVLFANLEN